MKEVFAAVCLILVTVIGCACSYFNRLFDKNDWLTRECDFLRAATNKLNECLAEIEYAKDIVEFERVSLKAECNRLKKTVISSRTLVSDYESLKIEHESLKNAYKNKLSDCDSLYRRCVELRQELTQLTNACSASRVPTARTGNAVAIIQQAGLRRNRVQQQPVTIRRSSNIMCSTCIGTGRILRKKTCPKCHGAYVGTNKRCSVCSKENGSTPGKVERFVKCDRCDGRGFIR